MFNQYNPLMYQGIGKTFSFTNILNNAQKTLNIVNQALPIVKEVKPIFKNAKTIFKIAKGFNNVDDYPVNNNIINQSNINKSNNGPNFFI